MARRFGNLSGFQYWNPSIVCWALGGYGLQLTGTTDCNTKEDLAANSRTVIMWGANLASQPSTGPAPDRCPRTRRDRGRRSTSAAPRRRATPTGWSSSGPGRTPPWRSACCTSSCAKDLVDRAFVEAHTLGFDALAAALDTYTPDWTAGITGVDAETVRWLARLYATQKPAAIVLGGASMFKHRGGWQASRAISCLPALTGQYGIAGGGLGPRHRGGTHGEGPADITAARQRPPGDYIPSHMPSMARAMRDGRIDVLMLFGTNSLASFADSNGLAAGLDRIGTIVCQDLFHTETTRRYADIVLPGTSWLEETGVKDTATHVYLTDQALRALRRDPLGDRDPGGSRRSPGPAAEVFPWDSQEGAVNALLAGLDGGQLNVERLRAAGRSLRARRSPTSPTRTTATRRPRARSSCTRSGRRRSGSTRCRPTSRPSELPETAPELAERYPLVFKQGRTFTSFHGFYDEARALPDARPGEPGAGALDQPDSTPTSAASAPATRSRCSTTGPPSRRRPASPTTCRRAWSGCATAGSAVNP